MLDPRDGILSGGKGNAGLNQVSQMRTRHEEASLDPVAKRARVVEAELGKVQDERDELHQKLKAKSNYFGMLYAEVELLRKEIGEVRQSAQQLMVAKETLKTFKVADRSEATVATFEETKGVVQTGLKDMSQIATQVSNEDNAEACDEPQEAQSLHGMEERRLRNELAQAVEKADYFKKALVQAEGQIKMQGVALMSAERRAIDLQMQLDEEVEKAKNMVAKGSVVDGFKSGFKFGSVLQRIEGVTENTEDATISEKRDCGFKILCASPGSQEEKVASKGFKDLSLMLHPDKAQFKLQKALCSDGAEVQGYIEELLVRIRAAHLRVNVAKETLVNAAKETLEQRKEHKNPTSRQHGCSGGSGGRPIGATVRHRTVVSDLWINDPGGDGGHFTGYVKDGNVPNGVGWLRYPNGDTFYGIFSNGAMKRGAVYDWVSNEVKSSMENGQWNDWISIVTVGWVERLRQDRGW